MRSVGLLPAAALVVGAAVGAQAPVSPHVPPIAASCALAVAIVAWWRRATSVTIAALLAGFFFSAIVIAADARDAALHTTLRAALDREYGGFSIDTPGPEGRHDPLPLRAILTEDAATGGNVVSLRARALALRVRGTWLPVGGGVALSVAGAEAAARAHEWRAGRVIVAPASFRRPARYLDDGVADAERDLALGGLTLFGSIKSGFLVDIVQRGSAAQELAADLRSHVRAAVAHWVSPHDAVAGAIVTAVLIGDRTGLPDDVRARLQAAGTYHVIAISGGNIAILAALVIGTLMVAGLHGRASALLAIVTLVGYSLVVTAGPSVWRATVTATLYLAARLVDHRAPAWHAVALAAGVLVVWQPLDVRDAGFILTFGATAALLCVARLARHLSGTRPAVAWMATSIAASLATELALMPVSAHTFSRVTSAGLLLNLVAVPAMAVAQVAGMAVVACASVPWLASAAGWIAWLGAAAIVRSATVVEILPWLATRVPPPSAWIIAAYYGALAGAFVIPGRRRLLPILLGAAAIVAIVTGFQPLRAAYLASPAAVRLTVFDVGQGDAMALQAGGETLLVDTGGTPFGGGFDIGGRVLAPALWSRGVRSLDTLVVTHGDPDHIGGALAVVDDFAPRDLWLGIPVPGHAPTEALVAHAAGQRIPIDYVRAGTTARLGPVRIRVLSPAVPDWERRRVRNDDSVVIEATYRDVALLLTGDVGMDVERAIVPLLTPARVRILKVAHHGSRTSSSRELLDAWRPQIAIVSCGRGNPFGHPAQEVLDRLAAVGARVYRTDRDGEVTVDTDGRAISVTTFVGGQR